MYCELTNKQLLELVNHQLQRNWGGMVTLEMEDVCDMKTVMSRLEKCFEKINSPYFWHQNKTTFKIEHSVQYAIFLYILSNELYRAGKIKKASFVYYLNKIMHSVEWFYAIELPEYFGAEHPLGSVLGKAVYGNYFFAYQGVTVGGNREGEKLYYPVIGEHVTMFSDSKIIGKAQIGDNTIIAANTYIKDTDIPSNSIVFGQYPNLIIKHAGEKAKQISASIWRK